MTDAPTDTRRANLGVLARSGARAAQLCEAAGLDAPFEWMRPPEIGSVMLRGRAGAVGAAFNLGEMTVTRCSLRLAGGAVGHGYVQGRDKAGARAAALVDALMQTEAAARVEAAVLAPLRAEETARKAARADRAAATKVDFFTMSRGQSA